MINHTSTTYLCSTLETWVDTIEVTSLVKRNNSRRTGDILHLFRWSESQHLPSPLSHLLTPFIWSLFRPPEDYSDTWPKIQNIGYKWIYYKISKDALNSGDRVTVSFYSSSTLLWFQWRYWEPHPKKSSTQSGDLSWPVVHFPINS